MLEYIFNLVVEGIAFERTGASTAGSTRGGALFIQSSTIEIYDCSFYNNRWLAAVVYLSNADAVVSGCRFDENYLTTGTGGMTIFSTIRSVYNSHLRKMVGWCGFAYGTVQVKIGVCLQLLFNHKQSSKNWLAWKFWGGWTLHVYRQLLRQRLRSIQTSGFGVLVHQKPVSRRQPIFNPGCRSGWCATESEIWSPPAIPVL